MSMSRDQCFCVQQQLTMRDDDADEMRRLQRDLPMGISHCTLWKYRCLQCLALGFGADELTFPVMSVPRPPQVWQHPNQPLKDMAAMGFR